MGFRRFTISFFIMLIMFVGINALIWFGWTREITDPNRNAGDLLRIGYILGHVAHRENVDDLPKRHIKIDQYNGQPIDVMTVGDSFSMGGGGGRNSHYQDYIASLQDMSVLSVPNLPSNTSNAEDINAAPVTTLSKLINSGYLDIIKPKYLLLESVERFTIDRLTKHLSLKETTTIEDIERTFRKQPPDAKRDKAAVFDIHFINNGNWKFIGNNLQYLVRDEAKGSKVFISKLSRRFFSSPPGDQLIFYVDDIKSCKLSTPASVAEANQNLNHLAAVLKAKGITLIFMPIVDKLDLFHPYLVTKRYPQNCFFEELRKLPKEYLYIDTKQILSGALEKGELDLYHQDDSHWTWKASETIFSAIRISKLSNARN